MSKRTISRIDRMISLDFESLFNNDELLNEINYAIDEINKIYKKEEIREEISKKEFYLLIKKNKALNQKIEIGLKKSKPSCPKTIQKQLELQEEIKTIGEYLNQIITNKETLYSYIQILELKKESLTKENKNELLLKV